MSSFVSCLCTDLFTILLQALYVLEVSLLTPGRPVAVRWEPIKNYTLLYLYLFVC